MNTEIFKAARERLKAFGYEEKQGDGALLGFSVDKAENTIKNDCNVADIPDGLKSIAVDMAVGEFLRSKKTFSPSDITGFDLSAAVKSLQLGDTKTEFAVGSGSMTDEQRLDALIAHLLNYGREEFSCYRRIRW